MQFWLVETKIIGYVYFVSFTFMHPIAGGALIIPIRHGTSNGSFSLFCSSVLFKKVYVQPYLINVSPFLHKHVLRIDSVPPDSEIDTNVLN